MIGITGLILAGGQGRRMGGVDKALQHLRGRPLVEWVIERLKPQVDAIIINANQNHASYGAYGYNVVADILAGHAGPLAGIHAGLTAAPTTLLATVPCDSPFLPLDLVTRLAQARATTDADVAVAKTGEQAHPVFMLLNTRVRPHLEQCLAAGERKIDRWYATLRVVEVAFDDNAAAFSNINTRAELSALEFGS